MPQIHACRVLHAGSNVHRSGLPRHDLVWYNATLSGKEIIERLPYLEPSEQLRNKFQYNNIMYMTAGYLVERAGGKADQQPKTEQPRIAELPREPPSQDTEACHASFRLPLG